MKTGYFAIRDELAARLQEAAPGYIQILTGPRQVGKTTLLLEIADAWGERALYLAADSPEAALPDWWPQRWQDALRMAKTQPSLLILDEVHGLPEWSSLLKSAYDEIKRYRLPLQIVISGSSSLQLTDGTRETMAGRFERLHLRHWTARDLMRAFALTEDEAVAMIIRYGAFPGGVRLLSQPVRWKTYLREAIVDPSIGTDILMLHPVRRPALLRQVLAICLGHPAEIVSLQKIAGSLTDAGNLATIAEYLMLLESAFLTIGLQKYSASEIRRRATPPKLVTCSNALLAMSSSAEPPTPVHDPQRWGRWLENACIATAYNQGHQLNYWREERHEVDLIVDGPDLRYAIEIKSGDFTARDLIGLLTFCERHRDFSPLVIGEDAYRDGAVRAGVAFLRWQDFLLDGLPT